MKSLYFLLLCHVYAHNHESLNVVPLSSPSRLSLPRMLPSTPKQSPIQQILSQIGARTPNAAPIARPALPMASAARAPPPPPPPAPPAPAPVPRPAPAATQSVKSNMQVPILCPFTEPVTCDPNFPYRTLDGSCNNLRTNWMGKARIPYKRLIRAAYADGLSEPRKSVDGSELPNARDITCGLHSEKYEIEPFVNHIFMQWGQWINHDITSFAVSTEEEIDIPACTKCERTAKCLPVQITSNFTCNCIQQMTHKCIEFTRSTATFTDPMCQSPERGQLNMQTAFLDGSSIYGVSVEDNAKLRDKSMGKGRMMVSSGNLLPKNNKERPSDCLDFTKEKRCFKAGDDRCNQNTGLMTFHTFMIREHNRIADILSKLNPQWSDETVFHETRRVVVAQIQHITYNEYLPILLGHETTAALNLLPGSLFKYNADIDARVTNEYAASYGRFGHSMIRTQYSRVDGEFNKGGHMPVMLRHAYFKANPFYDADQGGMESIVRGLVKDPVMKVDRWFTKEISNHLFETNDDMGRPFHFDLISINIQRGRDHGVPGYIEFRDFCRLRPVRTWDELNLVIHTDTAAFFRRMYKFVEDIDLFSAMVAEFKPEGALVGPTLNCLLGLQFSELKFGDRFWYETSESPAAFTPAQLIELRKLSLSKLLCRNLADTPKMPPRAMLSMKLDGNELKDCKKLEDIDWNFWKA
ncbi:chorion peroxidase isoform X1 [Brachionus plicatilis]|uniref:Chorion peroxidase isoform X1 n=1 Tax=Brachionus plicatilis TaxID=10195 RepID=A0A3M7PCZ0_BRAPC|nr:chorion peroxidase isoform X1 [Brachionus plicatilis]